MKRLLQGNRVPYGGEYRINRPDLGMVGTGYIFDVLLESVRSYRKANGIPIGLGFVDEVEKVICEQMPDECEEHNGKMPLRKRTLSDIIAGSRVMLSHWWNGRKLVTREESERRARICVSCPMNQTFVKSCTGICPELKQVVTSIVDAQGTQYDINLHSCQICGCYLSAAIWVPLDVQLNPLPEEQKEQFENVPNCWKKTSLLTE